MLHQTMARRPRSSLLYGYQLTIPFFWPLALQTAHATLTTEKQQIESERDQLRGVVTQIQDRQRLTAFTNPFGAIGTPVHPAIRRTARVVDSISDSSTENTPSNDSELERQNTNMREMLRNYGVSP